MAFSFTVTFFVRILFVSSGLVPLFQIPYLLPSPPGCLFLCEFFLEFGFWDAVFSYSSFVELPLRTLFSLVYEVSVVSVFFPILSGFSTFFPFRAVVQLFFHHFFLRVPGLSEISALCLDKFPISLLL